jgi:hypothetical protein
MLQVGFDPKAHECPQPKTTGVHFPPLKTDTPVDIKVANCVRTKSSSADVNHHSSLHLIKRSLSQQHLSTQRLMGHWEWSLE